ncbi:MAG: hypothetical protein PWP61_1192 [Trichococcus sp.]|jgi:hypothetical protein|nr:hypothetical protein [Trichococcus sp.]
MNCYRSIGPAWNYTDEGGTATYQKGLNRDRCSVLFGIQGKYKIFRIEKCFTIIRAERTRSAFLA